ncbi:MAG: carboxypeptidase-like regulatory domain-containing protein [Chitinophagaceae bacterium]
MKTPILLHIPEPCHENWDAMTPQDKGRHCQSCNKIVVDFSVMTDRQVLDYFKNAKGNTCGRFHDDQLQRPLIEPQTKPSKWNYLVASFLGFIMSGKIAAQSNITKGEVLGKIMPQRNTAIVIGDSVLPKAIIINGKVVDEKGKAIAGATVKIKGTTKGVSTNENGDFTIKSTVNNAVLIVSASGFKSHYIATKNKMYISITLINMDEVIEELAIKISYGSVKRTNFTGFQAISNKIRGKVLDKNNNPIGGATINLKGTRLGTSTGVDGSFEMKKLGENNKLTLTISSIGFETKEIEVTTKDLKDDLVIVLKESKNELKQVILQAPYRTIGKIGFVGGVTSISCKKIKPSIKDSTIKLIQKIFNNESIKIYPNPVAKNATIHITIKDVGEHSLQMFDTQSRLITAKNIITKSAKEITEFQLPSSVNSGTYYIRFINETTKKQVTEKLIVL